MQKILKQDLSAEMQALLEAAAAARANTYAPYSNYFVGAAVLDETNKIHNGCNVENAAYTGTHAEASAIAKLVSEGNKKITAVACVTKDGGACCGDCRQRIWELCSGNADVPIYLFDEQNNGMLVTIGELLPYAFELH